MQSIHTLLLVSMLNNKHDPPSDRILVLSLVSKAPATLLVLLHCLPFSSFVFLSVSSQEVCRLLASVEVQYGGPVEGDPLPV